MMGCGIRSAVIIVAAMNQAGAAFPHDLRVGMMGRLLMTTQITVTHYGLTLTRP